MNILERTKLLNRVAECDAKSAEAVAQNAALRETIDDLQQRIVALENQSLPKVTLTLKPKDGSGENGLRKPT